MMLPSVAPMVLAFSRISQERSQRGRSSVPTWVFVGGYLLAWVGYGAAAYGVFRVITALDSGFLAWNRGGPWIAGAAIAAAGIYQLTPLKRICLRHCRTPLHFVLHGWKERWSGALRMGLVHGGYCVGCCWGLMLILFALGVMSLFWMVVVAAIIFAEKVTPIGARLSRALAIAFVLFGIWMALAPGSIPGLTQPDEDSPGMMQMEGSSP
jgi:predicted metal-binding membrane protein